MLSFLDKVTHSVDSGNSIDVIFLDFAKAFDKVPHKRLILKLESRGISRKQWCIAKMEVGIRKRCGKGPEGTLLIYDR